ncbi:hypothetical protein [Yersinia pseudotuberculosis]|nr:hypothetical protein [Yersinia pseudotuberculosis]MBO1562482.1 hypothetical protein [Yersinia pseudotuberculosis]MBO1571459.1 hypothetical protein [Yersinia pseudotuberculosis]
MGSLIISCHNAGCCYKSTGIARRSMVAQNRPRKGYPTLSGPHGQYSARSAKTSPTAGLTPFAWYADTDFQATDMTGIEPAMFEVTVSAFFSYGEISAR